MPEDLPVTKRIDVMVGITRSKVICLVFSHVTFLNQSQPCRSTHLANGWPSTVPSVRPVGAGSGKYIPDPNAPTAKAAGPRVCHMESTGANRKPAPAEHRMRKNRCAYHVFST